MRTKHAKVNHLNWRIHQRAGILMSNDDVATLRRAQMTLHRWAELECGEGNEHASWAVERDEATGKPWKIIHWHNGRTAKYQHPDREKGALARIVAICAKYGLHYYHQTDPRGCALYISNAPLSDSDYSHGIACCD